jgi:hypothetical protein
MCVGPQVVSRCQGSFKPRHSSAHTCRAEQPRLGEIDEVSVERGLVPSPTIERHHNVVVAQRPLRRL